MLASVPNVTHWTVRANTLLGRFDYADAGNYDSTHLRWFTEKTLRSFFASLDAEVLWVRQAAGIELPVYHRSRILRRISAGITNPASRQLNRIAKPAVMFGTSRRR